MTGYEVRVLVEMTGLDEFIIVECVQREVIHARAAEAGGYCSKTRTSPGCAGFTV
jgi:hypothetical protein